MSGVFLPQTLKFKGSIGSIDHLIHLRLVFQTLRHNQFMVKKSKCTFGQRSVEYLGHLVLAEGVGMDVNKVKAMISWPVP